ncbi:MAG: hypothetical protein IT281_01185 [Ignavibacteria bacterium]|nr:hypothetical protein [Ignavibacteria bacterium]MCC7158134.1 hypothetical protein [Ignavibacteria bacterium]
MDIKNILGEPANIDMTGTGGNYAGNRISRFKTGIFINIIFFLLAGLIIAGTALYIIFMILKSI